VKKNLLFVVLALVMVTALFLTGCAETNSKGYTKGELEQSTLLQEAYKSEMNQERMIKAVPIPEYKTSQERQLLVDRLNRLNVENKIGYVYLTSYGRVMAFYTVKGKVMSINSLLTNPQQIVTKRATVRGANGESISSGDYGQFAVDSPDLDGTYGPDGPSDGIFFFTTDGAYVEYKGEYLYSDKPLKITTAPELVREIK
jgi:hypothetical protein